MTDQPPVPPPLTAQDFQLALRQPDEGMTAFVMRVYDETSAPYKAIIAGARQRLTSPEQLEGVDTLLDALKLKINLNVSEHKPAKRRLNYTGIHGDTPMEGDKSVARAIGQELTLPANTCLGCSATKPLVPGYACDDLADPAQIRSSQLNRAYVALHEVAHSLFMVKVLADGLKGEKIDGANLLATFLNMLDSRTNEKQADSFAAGLFIRYLGAEGTSFVQQWAGGFRYAENGTDATHDTALALANVLKRHREDPDLFTRGSLAGLMEMNVADAREMAMTSKMTKTFTKLGGFSGNGHDTPDEAYKNVQERMQQRALMQPAQQVMYDKYFRPADELMMNMAGLAENLQQLTRLSPLDPEAPLGPETPAIVAACKAKPGAP